MFRNSISKRTAVACAGVLGLVASAFVAGCEDDGDETLLFPGLSAELNAQLGELRGATDSFHEFQNVGNAGYEVLVAHPTNGNKCLRHGQLGAMGVHYLNVDLVDGAVAVASPEVVIYEPQSDGSLELVGIEYIVPFTVRGDDEAPPVLFGREFRRNYTFNLWALHAWAWRDNPSGVFSDWNPAVSCNYASTLD